MRALSGGGITIAVDARDGGKITSLVACDRERLEPSTQRDPSGDYAGAGGWDEECAPTVGACTLHGALLLDHGDAWRHPWHLLESTSSTLSMRVELATVGVTLRRIIRSTPFGLRLDYRREPGSSRSPMPRWWRSSPVPAGVISRPRCAPTYRW